jgi:hypothetical protein
VIELSVVPVGLCANVGVADKPDEMLASDAKFTSGHNPTVSRDSPANK